MSVVTFMIGNGFDLACGLKSRYIDTYDGYIESASSSAVIEKFKLTIKKDIQTWADFEMQLAEYAKELKSATEVVTCIRDYDKYLSDYLFSIQTQFWNDYAEIKSGEDSIQKEMERSLTHFYSGLTRNDIQAISSIFNGGPFVDFRFISFNYTNLFDSFLKSAMMSDKLFKQLSVRDRNTDVLHIHGALGGDVTLGVDNEKQLMHIPYRITDRAKRVLIKPAFLQAYDKERVVDAINSISASDLICIFGLSLGDSDLTWRELLASWLRTEKTHHLVFYNHKYTNRVYHSSEITRKMDDEEDAKETLFSLLFGTRIEESSKGKILERIHIPVGTSIFEMSKAFSKAKELSQQKKELLSKINK